MSASRTCLLPFGYRRRADGLFERTIVFEQGKNSRVRTLLRDASGRLVCALKKNGKPE